MFHFNISPSVFVNTAIKHSPRGAFLLQFSRKNLQKFIKKC
nr:MAG TPA: hypothetical protein [Caudoviricetes sp.]